MKHTAFLLLLTLISILPAWALTAEQDAKLLASDGAARDHLGIRLAFEGDTAVIGAYLDDDNGTNSGSAYVFTRSNGVWTEQAKLLASDGEDFDSFGWSVAISGDTALVGATNADNGDIPSTGAAYVFTRSGVVWTERAKLLASDGAISDSLGQSVALDGDTAVIGAIQDRDNGPWSGSAYVFTRSNGVWTEQAKLLASDGEEFDQFGRSVALEGDNVLIGADNADNGPIQRTGAAYVFTRAGGVWTEQRVLLASDGQTDDHFGLTVALHGDTALIGAFGASNGAGLRPGAAYVFTGGGAEWAEQAKLLAADGEHADYFGYSVALDGDTALVGAVLYDGNEADTGSAHVFTRNDGVWREQLTLLAPDGVSHDQFGATVAIQGDIAIIGQVKDDDTAEDAGAAYVFRLYDTDVPATGTAGTALLLLGVLGTRLYFTRRRSGGQPEFLH